MSYEAPPSGAPYTVPNSSLAIVSLITGILGVTFLPIVGSIVALVTGSMAKKEIRQSAGTLGGEGLANAGTILGWIGIGLSVIGLCVFGAILSFPFCLAFLGIATQGNQWLVPLWIGILF